MSFIFTFLLGLVINNPDPSTVEDLELTVDVDGLPELKKFLQQMVGKANLHLPKSYTKIRKFAINTSTVCSTSNSVYVAAMPMFVMLTEELAACESRRRVDDGLIYKAFGRAVAERRNAISKTQEQVAREIGLSRASLANIERGSQKVFLHQILALTKALGLESSHEIVPTRAPEAPIKPSEDVRFSGAKDLSKNQKALVTGLVRALSKSQDRK